MGGSYQVIECRGSSLEINKIIYYMLKSCLAVIRTLECNKLNKCYIIRIKISLMYSLYTLKFEFSRTTR